MPKLWEQTVEAHRREVSTAVLDTAGRLAAEHGPRAVTMSRIASEAGIGRATLYKYFADVGSILRAWHERHVMAHLDHLDALVAADDRPAARLDAVLDAYARIARTTGRHGAELVAMLHHDDDAVDAARTRLNDLLRSVLAEAAEAGEVRHDVPPAETAAFVVHALGAAGEPVDRAGDPDDALARLVTLVRSALAPPT